MEHIKSLKTLFEDYDNNSALFSLGENVEIAVKPDFKDRKLTLIFRKPKKKAAGTPSDDELNQEIVKSIERNKGKNENP